MASRAPSCASVASDIRISCREEAHGAGADGNIDSRQDQIVLQRLAHEHPVERVAVQGREVGQPHDVRLAEGEGGDAVAPPLLRQVGFWPTGQWQLSQRVLDY